MKESYISSVAVGLLSFALVSYIAGGDELRPARYSQHEYERHEVNNMSYQAARAACRYRKGILDLPVLSPAEIHYRWSGIFRQLLTFWYWAPMQKEAGEAWRWSWNGSLVDLDQKDMEELRALSNTESSCAVWRLNDTYMPALCQERHPFLCLRETCAWCRMRSFNKSSRFALEWDTFGYPEFDTLEDAVTHFQSNNTPVLFMSKNGRNMRKCKTACEDIHANFSSPAGCWFSQFYRNASRNERCHLLLSASMPATLYTVVPNNDTNLFFRTCFLQYPYDNASCWLSCRDPHTAPSTMTEALAEGQRLKETLTMPTTNLSATVRRKTSAPDARPTAQGIGAAGVAFAGGLLLIIFLLDLTSLKRDVCKLASNVKGLKTRKITD